MLETKAKEERVLCFSEVQATWSLIVLPFCFILFVEYYSLYNNKINARVLIGQSAMVYCAGKPMEKSRVFWIII